MNFTVNIPSVMESKLISPNKKAFPQTVFFILASYITAHQIRNDIKRMKDTFFLILVLTLSVSQLSGYTSKTFSKFVSALLKSPNLICTCPKPGRNIKRLKQ